MLRDVDIFLYLLWVYTGLWCYSYTSSNILNMDNFWILEVIGCKTGF